VLHDWAGLQPDWSQFWADALFRLALKDAHVPRWRRVLLYYLVRVYQAVHGRAD
jgi:hypothetical protein